MCKNVNANVVEYLHVTCSRDENIVYNTINATL